MYIPKRYGQSLMDHCPFCGKIATVKNIQGVVVCQNHKNNGLPDLKCSCNSYLELREGKFSAYFHCMNCGNVNMKKAMALNPDIGKSIKVSQEKTIKDIETKDREEIENNQKIEKTITSDDLDIYYS